MTPKATASRPAPARRALTGDDELVDRDRPAAAQHLDPEHVRADRAPGPREERHSRLERRALEVDHADRDAVDPDPRLAAGGSDRPDPRDAPRVERVVR